MAKFGLLYIGGGVPENEAERAATMNAWGPGLVDLAVLSSMGAMRLPRTQKASLPTEPSVMVP